MCQCVMMIDRTLVTLSLMQAREFRLLLIDRKMLFRDRTRNNTMHTCASACVCTIYISCETIAQIFCKCRTDKEAWRYFPRRMRRNCKMIGHSRDISIASFRRNVRFILELTRNTVISVRVTTYAHYEALRYFSYFFSRELHYIAPRLYKLITRD